MSTEQLVVLTEAGAAALAHMQSWLNGRFLRCRNVEVHPQGFFLSVVAVPYALPFEMTEGDSKLWIPLQHVDLVVAENSSDPKSRIGFV
jgi:hypothetical protein